MAERRQAGAAVVAVALALALLVGCGDSDDGGDLPSNAVSTAGVVWFETTSPDGRDWVCAWRYIDGGYDGGGGLWCVEAEPR